MAGLIEANDNDKITHHVGGKNEDDDDAFGINDDDWDIYRNINTTGFNDEDEEDQEAVNLIEKQIADIDPSFTYMMLQANSKMPTEKDFQIRLQVDQFRVPEILFQPSIIGVE